jgi:hypothetical protein
MLTDIGGRPVIHSGCSGCPSIARWHKFIQASDLNEETSSKPNVLGVVGDQVVAVAREGNRVAVPLSRRHECYGVAVIAIEAKRRLATTELFQSRL